MAKLTSTEEVVNHYGLIRLRVTGTGELKPTLLSLDEVVVKPLISISLQSKNNIEPTRLVNFTQQRAKLELRTTEIDEFFQISKIIVFVRPVAKSYPG